mmetsp:Transcript_97101/g.274478  ORF Transcript_97101/g.274478 Transcript_97101/m.274478 type:complete len:277 (-) Transcript_97101:930-1760(-)
MYTYIHTAEIVLEISPAAHSPTRFLRIVTLVVGGRLVRQDAPLEPRVLGRNGCVSIRRVGPMEKPKGANCQQRAADRDHRDRFAERGGVRHPQLCRHICNHQAGVLIAEDMLCDVADQGKPRDGGERTIDRRRHGNHLGDDELGDDLSEEWLHDTRVGHDTENAGEEAQAEHQSERVGGVRVRRSADVERRGVNHQLHQVGGLREKDTAMIREAHSQGVRDVAAEQRPEHAAERHRGGDRGGADVAEAEILEPHDLVGERLHRGAGECPLQDEHHE